MAYTPLSVAPLTPSSHEYRRGDSVVLCSAPNAFCVVFQDYREGHVMVQQGRRLVLAHTDELIPCPVPLKR